MPIATSLEPTSRDARSARFRLARSSVLQLEGGVAGQRARRHVELDVVLRQLGLVVLVGDRGEHLGVVEVRLHVLVDEVELDLQAGHRPVELEGARAQHPLEDVEVLADLLAVPLALLPGVALRADLCSHAATQPHRDVRGNPGAAFRSRPMSPPSPTVTGVRLIHTSDWHLGRSFHQVGLLDAQAAYLDHLVERRALRAGRRRPRERRRLRPRDARLPTPSRCSPRRWSGSSTPAPRSCCPAATTTRRSAWGSRATSSSAPGSTCAPPSPTSGGRSCSATSRCTRSPTSSRRWPPSPSAPPSAPTPASCARPWSGCGRMPRAAAVARSSWPTPSSPAASRASPSATSRWAASRAVPPEVFTGADYTALGHLHGRQEVADGVRYSGSPVRHVVQRVAAHQGEPPRRPQR